MSDNKAVELLRSRKFWASIVGVLASLGFVQAGGEDSLVQAIIVLAGAVAYVVSQGIADNGKEAERERERNIAKRGK